MNSTNGLLNPWVDPNHFLIQLWVVPYHDLRIPAGSNKNGIDTTSQRGREDVRNLEADQERIGHDNGCESPVAVVWRVSLQEVEVSKEGTCIANEDGTKGENRADKTVLRQLVIVLLVSRAR